MKQFTPNKVIRRSITIRSCDRALADAEWVLALDQGGVRIRRLGEHKSAQMYLTWRSVIGHALIHKGVRKP